MVRPGDPLISRYLVPVLAGLLAVLAAPPASGACPDRPEALLEAASGAEDPAARAGLAAELRACLEERSDAEAVGLYPRLWQLEFQTTSPGAFPALRERVSRDLERLAGLGLEERIELWQARWQGAQLVGDEAAAERAADALLERFPCSDDAVSFWELRWDAADPGLRPGTAEEERRAAYRRLYEETARRIAACPEQLLYRMHRFFAVLELPDLPAEEAVAEVEGFLQRWEAESKVTLNRPPSQMAARYFIDRGIPLDRVPSLAGRDVAEGLDALTAEAAAAPEVAPGTDADPWLTRDRPLPAFALPDQNGAVRRLEEFRGKTLFVNLWATWCIPCHAEHPYVQRLHEQLAGRDDVAVLTLSLDANPGLAGPYLAKKGYTFPVLFGRDWTREVLGRLSLPRNWIVDGDGVLRFEQLGFSPEEAEELFAEVPERLTALGAGER